MDNDFWLNLASKDLNKAREFFLNIGFTINDNHGGPHMLSLFVGNKKTVVNFFSAEMLQGFMSQPATDTSKTNEIILSIGASSKSEVDDLAKKAVAAGGQLFAGPGEKDGWMYGCGFTDLDGHRWNALYMDFSKMPKRA